MSGPIRALIAHPRDQREELWQHRRELRVVAQDPLDDRGALR